MNKVFNVNMKELIKVLQMQIAQGHEYADFEIESTEDFGTKLVVYPINDVPRTNDSSFIDPKKDPDDLINDLT